MTLNIHDMTASQCCG